LADVRHAIQIFHASDGYPIYYHSYQPAVPSKAHLVCIHGIQSHGGWYEASCTQLAAAGYQVSYFDRRGSGLNWLQRGDAPSYRRLLDDLREFMAAGPKDIPAILLATSWGGKLGVALAAAKEPPMQQLVLLCPGIFPRMKPTLSTRLGVAWSRFVKPRRRFLIPLNDPELFTLSSKWQFFLARDPLALHYATARLLAESFFLDQHLKRIKALSPIPTLLLLGGQDRIIRNDRTESWLKTIAPQTKVIRYPESHHTFEFEDNCPFVRDILTWIN
jgi:alpha-beta hydrolase superfamily lysophospholipase